MSYRGRTLLYDVHGDHLSYCGCTLLYDVHGDNLSYRGCTLSDIHSVLSSVPKQTRSVHQAEAVIALAGDFILLLYRMDHYCRREHILFGKLKLLVVHIS